MSHTPIIPHTPVADACLAPLPPPRVPNHELLRRIGRGAYGEVWLARSVTGSYRAVKTVHRASFDHDRPFEREFEGILKFEPISRRHDSQVDILHVGREDDCFYYIMELADDQATGGQINPDAYAARTLKSELMFHGRLPFEECVRLGLALATALEHLHENGLVHRDIKPSNIIFINGVPKLADIGLVTGVDATRSFVGTEGFAAPEGAGTAQADLFSLGKVLYEMATGKDRQEFPELPTQLRDLPDREGLVELNAVIAKACRHDPKDRYASAAAMRADLELLQGGKSLARLRRTEQQLRFVQRAGAIVTAIAALIAAGWLWQARQTQLVRGLAEEKSRLIEEKRLLAEENREQLVRLRVANGIRVLDEGDPATALLWFTEALPLVGNRPAEEDIHRIRIQQVLRATPRPLVVMAATNSILASAWSPDGRRVALATYVEDQEEFKLWVRVHDAATGEVLWHKLFAGNEVVSQLRFSRDGSALLAGTSLTQGRAVNGQPKSNFGLVLAADSGRELCPAFVSNLTHVAFSPDDRWLALADTNHVIRIVSPLSGTPVVDLKGHTNKIRMLSFNADGTLLASASKDRTVRLWRLPSGEAVGSPILHEDQVQRVVLSDDGRRMLTSTAPSETDGTCLVQLWDVATGRRVGDPICETNFVFALAFSPGAGDRFLLGGYQFEAEVRDSRTLAAIYPPIKMHSTVRCWDFSPDGAKCAVGSDDGLVYVWNLDGSDKSPLRFPVNGWVDSVHFSPNGKQLLATSESGAAKIWPLAQEAESDRFTLAGDLNSPPEDHRPRGLTPGPIAIHLKDGTLHLINPDPLEELQQIRPSASADNQIERYTVGLTGRYWAAGGVAADASQPYILDLWTKELTGFRRLALPHPKAVRLVSFNADDSRLFTYCRDGSVRIWRTSDGALERTMPVPESLAPIKAPFRRDGRALLVLVPGGPGEFPRIQWFDLIRGQLEGKSFSTALLRDSNKIGLSPDGTRLASVGSDQCGSIIDLQAGELAAPPFKHGGNLLDLDWSPDGKRLLTAGLHSGAKLWDGVTGERLLHTMSIGDKPARAARWSADGRFIVTRSDDNLARVWDAATAEAVTPLLPHAGYIRWACLTPGNRLITASDPNRLRAWDLKPTLLPAEVLADWARLLAGNRLDASGGRRPVPAVEQERLYRSLRSRVPPLFDSSLK